MNNNNMKTDNLIAHQEQIERLTTAIQKAIVIDSTKLNLIVAAMLAGGHVLLEDVPGVGKTLAARALAAAIHADFKRVQCTPDLLPSDITGGAIYNQSKQAFEFIPGPIFANIVLVDEINRASPRAQSSLLESMAEGQVSSDGFTRKLERPFFIIATQNPIEMAGTFPLPEAQMDRFLIHLSLGYPDFENETLILQREEHKNPLDAIEPVLELEDILALQKGARAVNVTKSLQEYIIRLTTSTRSHPDAVVGVSPRGGVALQRMAQSLAFLHGRTFVTPDDVKEAATAVISHRILTRDRRIETAYAIVTQILNEISVPAG